MTAAYAGLFVWSFLAATVIPLGSEPALFAVVRGGGSFWPAVAIATAGNVLGAATTWWIGRRVGEALDRRPAKRGEMRARALFARWGAPSLLLSWVPLIGDALVAISGAAGISFRVFLPWVTAGKLARYAAVAWSAGVL
ncbi:MAG TPA: YqaA family protein [Thermoanaerobaculia bacterium]|nr:YqaA family protein [Thermoanaerobaculia bacterium]